MTPNTVVIFAQEADAPVDAVVRMLTERDVAVFRACTSWFPDQLVLDAHLDDAGRWAGVLRTEHRSVDLADIRSIWYRDPAAFRFPAQLTEVERAYAHREARLGFGGVLAALPVLWMNHPNRAADAVFKPLQLATASVCGLSVQETMVTNSPDSNSVLITALRQDIQPPRVLSSSTQPGLMTRMLEALDVHDGHKVLEIGTGTGYNSGLLAHRIGSDNVFSVDVEPGLIQKAQERLRRLGFTPTLVTGDGAAGLAEHAPFDRIIATCAVPAIPWSWVNQTRIGGGVLADLKIAHGAGSLVRLTRTEQNRAEGRFDATYAAFMGLRHHPGGPERETAWADRKNSDIEQHVTTVDPKTPWQSMIVWFLAAFDLGPDISIGFTGTDTTQPPTAVRITTPDGSWAHVAVDAMDGGHEVTEGGPQRLWQAVETAHERWTRLDRPGWDRFGLTATPTEQTVWLDDPDSPHQWPISP